MLFEFCNDEFCKRLVDTSDLHVVLELEKDVYFHAQCFLASEWYDPKDLIGKSIIDCEENRN